MSDKGLSSKKENFSEWYLDVVEGAEIIDKRYSVKGFVTWMPYGTGIMKKIMRDLEEKLNSTGHREARFPLVVSEDIFGEESEHLEGFEDEVYWIDKIGSRTLDQSLVIRPTSETVMYPVMKNWIRSYRDLPLKVYQTSPVYRYETKHTRPLIRPREISWFNESHTCHATAEDAKEQIELEREIYQELLEDLSLPYVEVDVPRWEVFPGAEGAYEYFVLFPNGRVLETGSVNNLAKAFSKVYDLKYENDEGEKEYVHQTCFGQSERLLAGVIGVHGDDQGLIVPPDFAEIQVVIVPILFDENKEEVLNYSENVKEILEENYRVKIDDSDNSPGYKFNEWELKGVPLRIEIGPDEVEEKEVTLVRRDNREKINCKEDKVENKVKEVLKNLEENLKSNSKEFLSSNITSEKDLSGVEESLQEGKIVNIAWCGMEECAERLEKQFEIEFLGNPTKPEMDKPSEKCIQCGNKADQNVLVAKSY